MARNTSGSVAGLVQALVEAGHTDASIVTAAVREARPNAREPQIRKALAREITRRTG